MKDKHTLSQRSWLETDLYRPEFLSYSLTMAFKKTFAPSESSTINMTEFPHHRHSRPLLHKTVRNYPWKYISFAFKEHDYIYNTTKCRGSRVCVLSMIVLVSFRFVGFSFPHFVRTHWMNGVWRCFGTAVIQSLTSL